MHAKRRPLATPLCGTSQAKVPKAPKAPSEAYRKVEIEDMDGEYIDQSLHMVQLLDGREVLLAQELWDLSTPEPTELGKLPVRVSCVSRVSCACACMLVNATVQRVHRVHAGEVRECV